MMNTKTSPVETPTDDEKRTGGTTQKNQTNKSGKERPTGQKNSETGKTGTDKQAGARKGHQ